jgi:hypothetical protein
MKAQKILQCRPSRVLRESDSLNQYIFWFKIIDVEDKVRYKVLLTTYEIRKN